MPNLGGVGLGVDWSKLKNRKRIPGPDFRTITDQLTT